MMVILGTVIALLLGHSLAQVHVLPMTDPLAPLACYHCDEHMHSFPECLSTPVTCHADEVCSILYSTEKTNIKCQKATECASLASHAAGPCAEGGYLLNTGQCQTCCNTSNCVGDLISKNISVQNDDIFCPGQCSSSDLAACIHSQTHCTHGQFCEVTVDDHHTVHGACKAVHELQQLITHANQTTTATPFSMHWTQRRRLHQSSVPLSMSSDVNYCMSLFVLLITPLSLTSILCLYAKTARCSRLPPRLPSTTFG
uniref:TNFR-Cys domain-containing protein n=1 Tax=Biomphalaria glabrata TaxID=6526 RepID=A0A2C9KNB0_BIOGL